MEKEDIKIEFYTDLEPLANTEELHPKPMKAFVPSWWKETPAHADTTNRHSKTVKMCPSFPDYFSLGYVIPMWADTTLKYDWRTGQYEFFYGAFAEENPYNIGIHGNNQFLDHAPNANFLGSDSHFVFKFICPWYAKTDPGYSVLQLPMIYHFNKEFSVLPGVIDTDIHHVINQQVIYHGNGEEIFIKRGTPIAQYIPFKRSTYSSEVQVSTPEFTKQHQVSMLKLASTFEGGYRDSQRKRDAL